jgi:hypothetical protein
LPSGPRRQTLVVVEVRAMFLLVIDPNMARLTALVAIVALGLLLNDGWRQQLRDYPGMHTARAVARSLAGLISSLPPTAPTAELLRGGAALLVLIVLLYLLGIHLAQQFVVLVVTALLFGPEKPVRSVWGIMRGQRQR